MDKINLLTCRVCLGQESKNCVSLFIKHSDRIISDKICTIANVKIQEGDSFPDKICPDCLLELDTAFNFKIKCETSNTLLKSSLWDQNKCVKSELEDINIPLDDFKKEESEGENDQHLEYEYSFDYYDDIDVNNLVMDKEQREVKSDLHKMEPKVQNALQENINESKQLDNVCSSLECNECGENFKSKCKMRVHWKKVHFYDQLICNVCKRAFKSCKAFNRHKRNPSKACITASKIKIEGVGAARTYYCKQCSYFTRSVRTMEFHLFTHTGEKKFICNMCPKRFTQLSSLRSHHECHILVKKTTCQVCGKRLKESYLKCHLKRHNSNYVQCDYCKKMLKNKSCLIQHLKRHSGVKSYTCDKCGKAFYTLAELCTHSKNIHEKGKHIYKCDHCDYISLTASTLVKHKSRHTETNIPCIKCGKFFENAKDFKAHQKIHYGLRNYPCPYCEKKYMNRNSRSNHVVKFHKCRLLDSKSIKNEPSSALVKVNKMIEIEIPTISYS